MSSMVETETATQLVVVLRETASGMRARELIDILEGLNFVLELSVRVSARAVLVAESDGGRDFSATMREATQEVVRVRQLRYGSPVEIVIDLKPLVDFLSNGGWLVFLGLVVKLFGDSTGAWKSLEEALALRRARLEAKNKRKADRRAKQSKEIVSPHGGAVLHREEKQKMEEFIRVVVETAMGEALNSVRFTGKSTPGELAHGGSENTQLNSALEKEARAVIYEEVAAADKAAAELNSQRVDVEVE